MVFAFLINNLNKFAGLLLLFYKTFCDKGRRPPF